MIVCVCRGWILAAIISLYCAISVCDGWQCVCRGWALADTLATISLYRVVSSRLFFVCVDSFSVCVCSVFCLCVFCFLFVSLMVGSVYAGGGL